MGWLKDTLKVFTDPADIFGDLWGPMFDPLGLTDDGEDSESLAPVEIEPEPSDPALKGMARKKAEQDASLRTQFGIGGSRGLSRVVSPFGSGPVNRTRTQGVVTPVSNMSVATSPESEIDRISLFPESLPPGEYSDLTLRVRSDKTVSSGDFLYDRQKQLWEIARKQNNLPLYR